MKRRFLSVALAAVMICSMLSTTAFAAPVPAYIQEGQSMATTEVRYTVGSNYVIVIPSSINLNEDNVMTITATSMNIEEGKSVAVRIDANSSFDNGGNFYLHSGANKIRCDIYVGGLVSGLDYLVARFDSGNTTNSVLDWISFAPVSGGVPGTYTGTLYFKISVE
jgi:hypothetical protein